MTLWTILPLILGVLGLGGGAAFLIFGGGGTLAFLTIRALPSPAAIWRFLTSPVGVVFTMLALSGGFWVAGSIHGKRAGRAECEARIEQSQAAAKAADARITAEARAVAEVQQREAAARETAIKTEVQGYAEELTKRAEAACKSGADADRWNDGLSLSDDGVQGAVPVAPPGDGHRALPGALPKGKGK